MPPNHSLATAIPELDRLARASELRAAGAATWRSGWPELDAALPGGVPRAQVTEWAGPRSAGKTAGLRRLVASVLETGAGAAYVDGTGTLAPAPWVMGRLGPGGAALFWVVRPPGLAGVLAAAEELLGSGLFGLVIAEGADWGRTPVVRLQRLTRASGAALVAVVDRPGAVPLAGLRVRFDRAEVMPSENRCRVRVRARGTACDVSCALELPYRLPSDAGAPDRRGVKRAPTPPDCRRRANVASPPAGLGPSLRRGRLADDGRCSALPEPRRAGAAAGRSRRRRRSSR